MAEILIKSSDYTHPDPVKDRRGVHKRGDFINLKPKDWHLGEHWAQSQYHPSKEKFVLVICDEITDAEIPALLNRRDPWKDDFAYTIVSQNPGQGRYVVQIFEQNPGVAGQNNLTQAKVESFLSNWGCTGLTFTTNSCQFTFSLWNAVRSVSFWEYPLVGINFAFTLISYNSTTGVGRILVTFPATFKMEEVIRRIGAKGGTLIDSTATTVTFEIERSDILTRFRAVVKQAAEQTYMRHRYQVSAADVDAIIAAGGILTLTRAQVLAKLRDKMA